MPFGGKLRADEKFKELVLRRWVGIEWCNSDSTPARRGHCNSGFGSRSNRDAHGRLDAVLNSIPDGVATTDSEGRLTYTNCRCRCFSDWRMSSVLVME